MCTQHRAHVHTQWSQVSVLPRITSLRRGEQGIVERRNANRKEREKEGEVKERQSVRSLPVT